MANSFISETIYNLKREFGRSLELYIVKTVTPDLETGKIVSDIRKIKIARTPVLQTKDAESFKYGLSFIAANKNFTYGGLFGTSIRTILVDSKDLPSDYVWSDEQYIITENTRYNMKDMVRYEGGYGFICEEMKGQKLEKIYDFKDTLILTETVSEP